MSLFFLSVYIVYFNLLLLVCFASHFSDFDPGSLNIQGHLTQADPITDSIKILKEHFIYRKTLRNTEWSKLNITNKDISLSGIVSYAFYFLCFDIS